MVAAGSSCSPLRERRTGVIRARGSPRLVMTTALPAKRRAAERHCRLNSVTLTLRSFTPLHGLTRNQLPQTRNFFDFPAVQLTNCFGHSRDISGPAHPQARTGVPCAARASHLPPPSRPRPAEQLAGDRLPYIRNFGPADSRRPKPPGPPFGTSAASSCGKRGGALNTTALLAGDSHAGDPSLSFTRPQYGPDLCGVVGRFWISPFRPHRPFEIRISAKSCACRRRTGISPISGAPSGPRRASISSRTTVVSLPGTGSKHQGMAASGAFCVR